MSATAPGERLVLDWDGTVTTRDTLHLVVERFGDVEVFEALEGELGRLSLHEVIAREMATVTTPVERVVEWLLETVEIRPGFRRLVDEHDPLIVSAGFHELIDPVLEREGLRARVVANSVSLGPRGWAARFAEERPCVVCGEPCKRLAAGEGTPFSYVGDGVSDRCVSLAAERVFARDGLARWLAARDVPFEPFETLDDVADALDGTAPGRRAPEPGQ